MATRAAPRTLLLTLFDKVSIAAGGNAIGSAAADLTGCKDYRLVLRLDGAAGTRFTINELYGPAGAVQQLNTDIAAGALDTLGSLNFRGRFDVFGPRGVLIRVFNLGAASLKVSGSLYAVVE